MLFDITYEDLVNVDQVEKVVRMSEETARQYGFTGETLNFLVHVGIPVAKEWEFFFSLPEEFDPEGFWDCAEDAEEGWKIPDGIERFVPLGSFPISSVVIDPATGVVYQYSEGGQQVMPIHGDISSFVKTIISFLSYVGSYNGDDDDEDNDFGYDRRSAEVQALKDEIQSVDPLPFSFSHEYIEWVELFDNIEAGVYT
jgi:hypothetical protein